MRIKNVFPAFILIAIACFIPASFSYADDISLSWIPPDANADGSIPPNISGYKIYYGTSPGTYLQCIDVGHRTGFTLKNMPKGLSYYLVATAYNWQYNESEYSNEIVRTTDACTNSPARITGASMKYFSALQSAYDASSHGSRIQSQGVVFREHLNLDRNIPVIFETGYDCEYASRNARTVVDGKIAVIYGKVVLGNGTLVLEHVD